MDKLQNYNVAFTGLKVGKHQFKFKINQAFFDLFGTEQEFFNPEINIDVLLDKHSTFLEFWIEINGTVQLICDISNDEFSHPVENEMKILVKQGEEYDDSNEEVITIPHTDSDFNIAQLAYELVTLSIPMKKLSPNLGDDNDYQKIIDQYSPKIKEDKEENQAEEIDPRWEALKKLKDNN
ncbi:YceD family protein [Chryseobacterium sp. T1]